MPFPTAPKSASRGQSQIPELETKHHELRNTTEKSKRVAEHITSSKDAVFTVKKYWGNNYSGLSNEATAVLQLELLSEKQIGDLLCVCHEC